MGLATLMGRFDPVGSEALPVFHGGAVGYLAYDAVRYFEPTVPAPPEDQLGVPDMVFMVSDTVLIFDHRFRKLKIVSNVFMEEHADAESAYAAASERIGEVLVKLSQPLAAKPFNALAEGAKVEPQSNTTKDECMAMVEKAKEYILAGDIF